MEDIKLVKNVLNGNIDSFNILVHKYELMILKFVYNMIKDKEAAEDITQEVFITIYNKLYLYDKRHKFSNWILQISKNKCIDYIRKYKRVYEANIEEARGVTSKEISPEQAAEYNEMKQSIEKYIGGLEETDRQILILRYAQDLTFHDMAIVLEMNESTVKRRYYKARENFKQYMKEKEMGCK